MEIEDKIIPEEKLAIINYKGNVEDMGILIGKLTAWAAVNEVELAGHPFAMYYTSPETVAPEEMVYDMGIPIAMDCDVDGDDEINVVELLEHRVIAIVHKGSYSTLKESYSKLAEYSIKYSYDIIGSPREVYFNSPHEVPEDELMTEIQFPVIKM